MKIRFETMNQPAFPFVLEYARFGEFTNTHQPVHGTAISSFGELLDELTDPEIELLEISGISFNDENGVLSVNTEKILELHTLLSWSMDYCESDTIPQPANPEQAKIVDDFCSTYFSGLSDFELMESLARVEAMTFLSMACLKLDALPCTIKAGPTAY